MKKNLPFLLLAFLFVVACKKEVITVYQDLSEPQTWQKATEIDRYNKFITNGFASQEKAYFSSPGAKVWKYSDHVDTYANFGSYTQSCDISPDFHLNYFKNGKWEMLGIGSAKSPNTTSIAYYIDTLSDFGGMGGIYRSSKWNAIRTDQEQYLFQYYGHDQYKQNFGLVDFEVNPDIGIENKGMKTFQLNKDCTYYRITIKSFYNKYFVCFGPGLEVIAGDASVLQTSGLPSNMHFFDIVQKGDSLIAFGDQAIYYSHDEGTNWSLIADQFSSSVFSTSNYQYQIIDNEIILRRGYSIVHLKIEANKLTLRPIVNDALVYSEITSLFEFRDTVYATTTSGTYKKAMQQFFTYADK